ncbi:MAG: DUF2795 domain-containing protein [Acidimicrobiia bacterium]
MAHETLQDFLLKIDFPADKRDLLDEAGRHGLGEDLVVMLEQLSDREYDTAADVRFELDSVGA